MRGSSFFYLVKHGVASLWLNRLMSIASIAILSACLLITGGAGIVALSAENIFNEVEGQNEMVVFILEDATEEQKTAIENAIKKVDCAESYRYVSKEAAFEEQKEYLGSSGHLLDGLEDENPFPASFRISLNDISRTQEVSDLLSVVEGVDYVQAAVDVATTLTAVQRTLYVVGGVIIVVLAFASLMVISNTIKLTVFARRREINIMKYVGATNHFIRLPFVVEGITIGLISAVIAFLALWGISYSISEMLATTLVPWISSMSSSVADFGQIWYWLLGGFAVAGVVIGAISSASAIRKYMRV